MLPVTPRPCESVGRIRFNRRAYNMFVSCRFMVFLVVALRIELSTTRVSAVSGPPALDYLAIVQVGKVGLEPTISCSQNTLTLPLPYIPFLQSERPDLNRRSRGPRPRAIPHLRYVLVDASAHAERKVDQGAIESPSPGFQPGAIPSQLPVRSRFGVRKKPVVVCDTGLERFFRADRPGVTSANAARARYSPDNRRSARRADIRF